ncbi:hypothetical protein E2C01_019126 [Portunus trituberculatus]|uniref:Uncharacterized protein n=1 Tax=Portunus trituberculatus TaxID=210409 RepID=A0A5B7DY12_PORTR|nr:hypothetical protein [Portunus trituberculatus]
MEEGQEPPLQRHEYTLRASPSSVFAYNGCSPSRRDLSCLPSLPALRCDTCLFHFFSDFWCDITRTCAQLSLHASASWWERHVPHSGKPALCFVAGREPLIFY